MFCSIDCYVFESPGILPSAPVESDSSQGISLMEELHRNQQ